MILDGKKKAYQIDDQLFHCGTTVCLKFIGGKWKSIIIWYLRNGVLRFSEIKSLIPDITDKMLSLQLKALQADGLVEKKTFGSKPPYRVEYQLTEFGKTLVPVIQHITEWGIRYAEEKGELVEI